MSNKVNAADPIIEEFKEKFAAFKIQYALLISKLESERNNAVNADPLDEMFLDSVSDLKGQLGTSAANGCSDDEEEQEVAIDFVESWVSESNLDQVPLILWMRGIEQGTKAVRDELKISNKSKKNLVRRFNS